MDTLPAELILEIADLVAKLGGQPFDMVKLAIATRCSDFLAEYEYCAISTVLYIYPNNDIHGIKIAISSLRYYCATGKQIAEEEYVITNCGAKNCQKMVEMRTPNTHLWKLIANCEHGMISIWSLNNRVRAVGLHNAKKSPAYNFYRRQLNRAASLLQCRDPIFTTQCKSFVRRIDKITKKMRHGIKFARCDTINFIHDDFAVPSSTPRHHTEHRFPAMNPRNPPVYDNIAR